MTAAEKSQFIRAALPAQGLFAGQSWRVSPEPFVLGENLAAELDSLGRILLQFYRAANLLYRKSAEGKQPEWVARWLDLGKPRELIELQRSVAFKNDFPRVIRPDVLLTENGFTITELDSVPGGIGLTAWLNQTYSNPSIQNPETKIIGGADGMLNGFASIFGGAKKIHLVVSEEAGSYKPEMLWLAEQLNPRGGATFGLQPSTFNQFAEGDAVYRFFELFDLPNVASAKKIFELAAEKKIRLTPPPKPLFGKNVVRTSVESQPAWILAAGIGRGIFGAG